jgi:2,4-diaminopentanoate dehydrogenase
MSIRAIQIGLGPIGLGTVERLLERSDVEVVAAVDPAPDKVQRILAELLNPQSALKEIVLEKAKNITVSASLDEALTDIAGHPHVAIHTTGSFLEDVTSQILEIVGNRINLVSTTEELAYPWWHHPDEARVLDEAAKKERVTVLGTGVNPGFVMDLLPVCLSGISAHIETVEVERVVDAGKRRGPLKKKVGAGITPEEFDNRKTTGRFGHIGLAESVALIAAAFNWNIKDITDELNPKIAEEAYSSADINVAPGNVLGIDQVATGIDDNGNQLIRLHLQMYVGARFPHDTVRLKGYPDLEVTVNGGTPGDIATVSAAVNNIPLVIGAEPGLKTPIDIPVIRWFGKTANRG